MTLLKALYAEATEVIVLLQAEAAGYKAGFDESVISRNRAEDDFFNSLNKLDSKSEEFLEVFVAEGTSVVGQKARYKSTNNLAVIYESVLKQFDARIKDIELNEDALIKGIEVFDVRGSDLELIIEEDLVEE